jgi:hypothetical protein
MTIVFPRYRKVHRLPWHLAFAHLLRRELKLQMNDLPDSSAPAVLKGLIIVTQVTSASDHRSRCSSMGSLAIVADLRNIKNYQEDLDRS